MDDIAPEYDVVVLGTGRSFRNHEAVHGELTLSEQA